MQIEMVEFSGDEAMHLHDEVGVKAQTEDPMGPGEWDQVWRRLTEEQQEHLTKTCEVTGRITTSGPGRTCMFYVDHQHESDPETTGYVQWWIFPTM